MSSRLFSIGSLSFAAAVIVFIVSTIPYLLSDDKSTTPE